MKILVLVYCGMTSAFLAECFEGDRTQGQQSVKIIVRSQMLGAMY